MMKMTKAKVFVHSVALFAVMLVGSFLASLFWDINMGNIILSYRWMVSVLRVSTTIGLTYALFYYYTKYILHSDMKYFRIGIPKVKRLDVILAFVLPGIVIASYIFMGELHFNHNLKSDRVVSILIRALCQGLNAGILEEILFRGFILKLVETKWNKYVAIVVPSLLFSLAHIPSMKSFHIIDLLLLIVSGTLVGVMFSLVTYESDSIWGSALIHTIWNTLIISDIIYFGEEVESYTMFSVVFSSENVLVTGGSFGIESSLVSIIAYSLVCMVVLLYMKHKNKVEHK